MALTLKQTNSLKKFEADLKKFSKTIDVSLDKVVRKISFDVFRGVVKRSPVDTGRFRSSWNINAGKADLSVKPKLTKSLLSKSKTKSAASGIAIRKASAVSLNTYQKVFITNNLPYASVLENGSSKQSPKGMVKVTLAEVSSNMVKTIKEATRLFK